MKWVKQDKIVTDVISMLTIEGDHQGQASLKREKEKKV